MVRVAAIGECMIELSHVSDTHLRLGYAGDTYNFAVYLARSTQPERVDVDYVTLVGDDWYSDALIATIRAEGVGTALTRRLPGRSPGLYLIRTDGSGERTFTYYRSQAPARELFAGGAGDEPGGSAGGAGEEGSAGDELAGFDVVYLSAITLQIMRAEARERLWTALEGVRAAGGRVVFDSNYRPSGWDDPVSARRAIERTLDVTSVALPTLDDERRLFGDEDAAACARRHLRTGVAEVVVKDGANGCLVATDDECGLVPTREVPEVVDTTAAGDSFNAGYLAARLDGASPVAAAERGHRLAALVIGHPGAIVPEAELPARGSGRLPAAALDAMG